MYKSTVKLIVLALLAIAPIALPVNAAHRADANAGKQAFEAMNCSMCHPGGGNALNPKKPLRGQAFKQAFADDADIAKVIRMGVRGTAMDAFRKDRLSDDQLDDIIAYIRTLTPPEPAKSNSSAKATPKGNCSPKVGAEKGKSSSGKNSSSASKRK